MHRVSSSTLCRPARPLDRRRLLGGAAGAALALAAMASSLTRFPAAARQGNAGDDASPREAIAPLLALVPDSVANEAISSGMLFSHADLGAQFAALGVDRADPAWIDEVPIAEMTMPLALMSVAFQYGLGETFPELFGFHPFDLDRALETGVPPNTLSILQGDLDRERLEAVWEDAGYEAVALEGGRTLWTKGEEGVLDPKDPALRIGAGAMGNLLLLNDATLAIARKGAVLRDAARLAEGGTGASMREMPQVLAAVDALLPTTASSMVIGPAMLLPRPEVTFSGSGTPSVVVPSGGGHGDALPAVLLASFGIEAGARAVRGADAGSERAADEGPVTRAQVRLVMGSAADAAQAVAVVPERWETLESPVSGRPYAELMTLLEAAVLEEEPSVAAFDFDPGVAGNRWSELVMRLDLLPFAPGPL